MSALRLIVGGGLDEFHEPRTLDTGRLSDDARARLLRASAYGFSTKRRCACGRFVERGHWGCEWGVGCRR